MAIGYEGRATILLYPEITEDNAGMIEDLQNDCLDDIELKYEFYDDRFNDSYDIDLIYEDGVKLTKEELIELYELLEKTVG